MYTYIGDTYTPDKNLQSDQAGCSTYYDKQPNIIYCGDFRRAQDTGKGDWRTQSCSTDFLPGGAGGETNWRGLTHNREVMFGSVCPKYYQQHMNPKTSSGLWDRNGYYNWVCEKKRADDRVWNPYFSDNWDDLSSSDWDNAIACCSGGGPGNMKCGDLICKNGPKCKQIFSKYCFDHPEDPRCKAFCNQEGIDCTDNLKNFCADKIGKSEYLSTCACYYPQEIYDKIVDKIAEDYNIPESMLDSRGKCVYNACKSSPRIKDDGIKCPDVSVVSCVQDINIDADGDITGDINVKQSGSCSGKITKKRSGCKSNDDCESPKTCNINNGQCIMTECKVNADCGPSMECSSSKCVKTKDSEGIDIKYIIAAFIALILIVFIITMIIYSKK